MATDVWNGTGSWTGDPVDWSLGAAPNASAVAEIASGANTLTTTTTVEGVTIAPFATLGLTGSASLTTTTFFNLGGLQVNTGGNDGGASVSIKDTLDNAGVLTIGNSNLTEATSVTAGGLINTGSIVLWGNANLADKIQSTLDITVAAPTVLTGSVDLHGDSDLEFASGGITGIASGVTLALDGAQSRLSIGAGATNSALSGLSSNAGTIDFEGDWDTGPGGAVVTTTGGLSNSGTLQLDIYGGDGASTFSIGGTLVNSGSIYFGNGNLSATTTLSASGLTNTGAITLQGNDGAADLATLDIAGAAPTTLIGSTTVRGDADAVFASGSITAIGAGAYLEIDGSQARVSIGAAATNSALTALASNAGTLDLYGDTSDGTGGAKITTTVGFINSGTLNLDTNGGEGGSSLAIGGVLTNRGGIDIGNGSLATGTTISATGLSNLGGVTVQGNSAAETTVQATVDITAAAPATFTASTTIRGDADLAFSSGAITAIGAGAYLEIDGSEARLSIGAGKTNSGLADMSSNAGTLALFGDTSYGAGGTAITTTVGFLNTGTLVLDTNGGEGGSSLAVGGLLTNRGGISIGNTGLATATTVSAAGLSNVGSITLQGQETSGAQATFDIAAAAPSTLTATTIVRGNADFEFKSGAIAAIGAGNYLEIDGSLARVSIGAAASNSALVDLSSNAGTLALHGDTSYGSGGTTITTTVGFINSGSLILDTNGGEGGSSLVIGGLLTNRGGISIGNTGLATATTVSSTGFSNVGSITLQGQDNGGAQATFDIAAAAPSTLTATTVVRGNADFEFKSGAIAAIGAGAYLEIDGSQARVSIGAAATNSALSDLSSNAGEIDLQGDTSYGSGGTTITTTVGFLNTGTLLLDTDGGEGGSSLAIGGVLTNRGAISIGNTGLATATTVSAASLSNVGGITLQGQDNGGAQATMTVAAAAPSTLTATTVVRGNADFEFKSGAINTIGAGAYLEIDGSQARVSLGAATTNSALADLSNNSGTLALHGDTSYGSGGTTITTTVGFTNSGSLILDTNGGEGGSSLVIGGVLTNRGGISIGNTGLATATTVSAIGLTNLGSITLQGQDNGGAQATFAIAAAAPSTLTATTVVRGNADFEFKSGAISAIGAGAYLEIDGSQARVSIGAATTNSALADLSSNSATLALHGDTSYGSGGTAITTTVGFTNNGSLVLDTNGGEGGSSLAIGGVLTNRGAIGIGNTGLGSATTVSATGLSNVGSITVQGQDNGGAQATLDIASAAAATLTATTIIRGNADLEFKSGAITAVGANGYLEIDGSQARISIGSGKTNSALTDLSSNVGTIDLQGGTSYGAGGAAITTTVGFSNSGTLNLDTNGGDGGSSITIAKAFANSGAVNVDSSASGTTTSVAAASLTNSGSLGIASSGGGLAEVIVNGAVTNSGAVSVGGGTKLNVTGGAAYVQTGGSTTVGGVLLATTISIEGGLVDMTSALTSGDGTGALNIYAGGTLEIGAAVDASHTVTFKSGAAGGLTLGDAGAFAGTIAGFAGDDVIDLLGETVTGVSYSGSATSGVLTVSGSGGALATLAFTGDYNTGDFGFISDGNGGTDILDPPASAGATATPSGPRAFVEAVAAFAPQAAGVAAMSLAARIEARPMLSAPHAIA